MPYSVGMNLFAGHEFDGPAAYQITAQGIIGANWSDRLEGMSINLLVLNDGTTFTILTGNLADQAALSGVLNTIYGLGLSLIAVNKLPVSGSRFMAAEGES